jgi:8-oxo-dGTP diphosphatase
MNEPPPTPRTRVTAAIIEMDGKILLARRTPERALGGTWEFPGGKIDPGETPEACLTRELHEEFDIVVAVGSFVAASVYRYNWGEMELLAYRVRHVQGAFMLHDHDAIAWVAVPDLLQYNLAPADVPIANYLLHQ